MVNMSCHTSFVRQENHVTHAGKSQIMLVPMGATPDYSDRLRHLMKHLNMSAREFARATSLSESYISRILTRDRGASISKDPNKLRLAAMQAFGVPDIFWQGTGDEGLEGVAKVRHTERVTSTSTTVKDVLRLHDSIKLGLVQLAAERGESGDVIRELALTTPPDDADVTWWMRRYFELVDKYS